MNRDLGRQSILEEEKKVYEKIMNSYCVFEKRKRFEYLKKMWEIH